ncbi:hypothetical protein, partial [Extibacter muris]|uniref:hypothetical protein n=1 Tax=Extibacter muris TaxID=1796622 RepID=UPI001A9B81DD
SVTPYIPVLACMIAGLIVVLFLPENFFLLFLIIYLTFNSWSFSIVKDFPKGKVNTFLQFKL